ncbi:hypothetical protein KI387_019351, partial [Taxus chinensis]
MEIDFWLRTPKRIAVAAFLLVAGIGSTAVGAHLSYKYIAPQQERIKKRNDFVRERLKARRS